MKGTYLQELNTAQRQAVEKIEGASLIIAGAGSGKTKVLTCRIAYMLECGISPSHILALTFTNKAAKEMKERVAQLVGPTQVRYLWMGTFHAVFARILRTHAERLGYPTSFTIYDKTDAKSVVKACLKELQLDDKIYPINDICAHISRAKNNLTTAQAYAADGQAQQEDGARRQARFCEIFLLYAKKCKLAGAMDFDDLLLNTYQLFTQYPDVVELYRSQFKYIMVDEYQDTNYAQYLIVRSLAQPKGNIAVVGDDAQSIYAFRGARIENIWAFKTDFKDVQTFRLEQNYRSTQTVVDAANSLIKHNTQRMNKDCFSKAEVGDKIEVLQAYTDMEEAFLVVSSILSRTYADKATYGQFAILYRTNAQSRPLEEALRKRNIPYRIYGGFSFYERAEVKDLMAYLRLLVNPKDNESFRRVVNLPARGIGDTTLQKLTTAALFAETSMLEFIWEGDLKVAGINAGTAQRLQAFAQMIRDVAALEQQGANAFEVANAIASASGYIAFLKQDASIEGKAKYENVQELMNSIQVFCGISEDDAELEAEVAAPADGEGAPTLERFLSNVALLSQMDETKEADTEMVNLMTVHAAKGLEFPYVFVVGMEEQLFPSVMSGTTQKELEEERRLFYVAMTRAKKSLTLSYAQNRMRWGQPASNPPSRFLREIDTQFLSQKRPTATTPSSGYRSPGNQSTQERPTWNRPTGYSQRTSRSAGQPTEAELRGFFPSDSRRSDTSVKTVAPLKPQFSRPAATATPRVEGGTQTPFVADDVASLAEGMLVEHDRFGRGRIVKMEGIMPNTKAIIEFEMGGSKTLLLKFAKLRRIE